MVQRARSVQFPEPVAPRGDLGERGGQVPGAQVRKPQVAQLRDQELLDVSLVELPPVARRLSIML